MYAPSAQVSNSPKLKLLMPDGMPYPPPADPVAGKPFAQLIDTMVPAGAASVAARAWSRAYSS